MGVEVKGLNKLLNDLEKKLGKKHVEVVSDKALKAGAKEFVAELRRQFATFKDTGASLNEITISEPYTSRGVRMIKIHWKGAHERYRIIHLNEWGTVHNPKPRGKGAIARAMHNAEKAYKRAVAEAIRRGF
ncbi:HK97-gp10 family putative phage morphogenesis protein [Priestia megaterium]|uniref:HK97-gp10 family putative phage morphogenesis protein n=1 Tax=Priestia megaterium TaxID=1404 RepID=UPI000BFCB292|nr:HK97-gp10 family putative phage morphogenesis protein [Priestia megaterium]PGR01347.1 hypothetical protein COA23_23135 [Priestia megaterium]